MDRYTDDQFWSIINGAYPGRQPVHRGMNCPCGRPVTDVQDQPLGPGQVINQILFHQMDGYRVACHRINNRTLPPNPETD